MVRGRGRLAAARRGLPVADRARTVRHREPGAQRQLRGAGDHLGPGHDSALRRADVRRTGPGPAALAHVVRLPAVAAPSPGPEHRLRASLVDGRSTTPIQGEPADIKVSPDGRYAGWIDFHGPKRAVGRLAEAVVVDLRTGETVLRNHDDMGGPTDDLGDLYEDAEVSFLGFDETYAYWDTPTGEHQRRRAAIGTWKIEPAGRSTGDGSEEPIGHPYDSLTGLEDEATSTGHLVPTKDGLTGFRSPSTTWCLTDGQPGRLPSPTAARTPT